MSRRGTTPDFSFSSAQAFFRSLLGLIALVIAAFTISLKPGTTSSLPSNLFVHPHNIFLGLMLALQGVVITYDGWYAPILLISVVAVVSSINAALMYIPRILFSMSRDGLLPRGITSVNRGGTPAPALFLCAAVSIALVLSGSFDALIAIGSILFVAVYLSGFASLLILRRREPDLVRPYKAWWYPWSTLLVLLASAAFLLGSVIGDLKHSLFTAILILLSYVGSILIIRAKSHEPA